MNSEVKDNKLEATILTLSPAPHIRGKESVAKIMWTVNLALAPAAIFSVIKFGLPAFYTILTAVVVAILAEAAVQKLRKKTVTINDGSAFLTGLLLAMVIPPTLPPYMTAVGAFIAIVIAKHAMGGLGYNIFNPAQIGRAALMASWPVAMTSWSNNMTIDATTSATTLNILKEQGYSKLLEMYHGSSMELYRAIFFGAKNGSLGEASVLLILLGGIFLIYKRYIYWAIPATMIGTVAVTTWIFGKDGFFTGDPILAIGTGGLMIGAFFMATDMVTIPITKKGRILFAFGAGILTALIRLKGGYPEGVCYAILIMNAFSPLIDRFFKPVKYGEVPQVSKKGGTVNA